MIKYKKQNYKEYIENLRKEFKPTELHRGMMDILRVYFGFIFGIFFNTHTEKKFKMLEVGGRLGEGGYVIEEMGLHHVFDYKNMEIDPSLVKGWKYNIYGDICRSRLRKDTYDIVFLRKTLGYLEDVEKGIKKMIHITKPGGMVVIVQPIPYGIDPHYNSMDSVEDLTKMFDEYDVYDGVGDFHEPVFILRK